MKTIIDEINVSKCKYFSKEQKLCYSNKLYQHCDQNINCYYKQLQKALQDIEAYKLESNEAAEIIAELEYKNEELKKKLEK